MPRKFRLSRADFAKSRGFKRLNSAFFVLSYGRILERSTPGGACVVSSKIARHASDRALIKRRCRAILSGFLPTCAVGEIYILIAKKPLLTATFKDIQRDVSELLTRASSTL